MQNLVTQQTLINLLATDKQIDVIGRALVVLFKNQTEEEKRDNDVKVNNNVGFTGADGRSGTITAKYYIKHGTLLDWQIERWMSPNVNGVPRIAKYWKQLNVAANQRVATQKELPL